MLSLFCGQSQMAAVSAEKRSAACRRLEDIAILGLVPLAAPGAVLLPRTSTVGSSQQEQRSCCCCTSHLPQRLAAASGGVWNVT